MSLTDWQNLLPFLALLGTLAAIYFRYRSVQKQLTIQNFSNYTQRYQAIILNFPENINDQDFKLDTLSKADRAKLMRYMRAYFDLCSEQLFLYRSGLLDKKIWAEWREGIFSAISKPAFRQAWETVRTDTAYSRDFRQLVEDASAKRWQW